jgi:hypothetical protein
MNAAVFLPLMPVSRQHSLNLQTICNVHERHESAGTFSFEKKLENCDLLKEYMLKFRVGLLKDQLKEDRDYRDKEK